MYSSQDIHAAYLDCRRRKRGTINALRFELWQAKNLVRLEEELNSGAYRPSRSVCFVTLKPKPREIFAADFRDRVVHHLLIRKIEPHWEQVFVHDSYACRPGKGTHAAVERLSDFLRSITQGGRRRAWFLQVDVRNFFMSIDKRLLYTLVDKGLRRQFDVPSHNLPLFCEGFASYRALADLARLLIEHDPTECYARKSPRERWRLVSGSKSLFQCDTGRGLPIGNLTSQFFANIYLNELDQFVKHKLKAKYYIRYVDDFLLLHEDKAVLQAWFKKIEAFLSDRLRLRVNSSALRLRPVSCGINFLGYVSHPDHSLPRRRVVGNLRDKLAEFKEELIKSASLRHDPSALNRETGLQPWVIRYDSERLEKLLAVLNSYLAHLEKASSVNVVREILEEHNWLFLYFRFDGFHARRTWKPPRDFSSLAAQYHWFRQTWPESVILFQVGCYVELFGRDAIWAQDRFGLTLLRPRFWNQHRVGVPASMTDRFAQRCANQGRDVLIVRETGYPLWTLRERFPDLLLRATNGSTLLIHEFGSHPDGSIASNGGIIS